MVQVVTFGFQVMKRVEECWGGGMGVGGMRVIEPGRQKDIGNKEQQKPERIELNG